MINYQYINKFWEDSVDKQYLIETANHSIQITNQNLHSQTISITESLTSNSGGGLSFGDCEASCIKFRVTRDNAPLVNKWLNVYVTMSGTNNTPFLFGRYKVISDKPVDGNRYREIVAYDRIYFVMNRDCTRWYKRMFREHTSMTIKQFRDAFFERFNITQKTVTLINDSVTINKAKVSKLSGRDIIKVIGEINGVFGHLGRDGEFNWISLDSTSPYPISRSYVIGLEYEDYNAAQMERIEILKADGSLAVYAGASEDDTDDQNTYVVESNFILASINNMDVLQNIADNLYLKTDLISFRPITDCELKGNPCIEVGDCISFTTSNTSIYTFVLQRTITGTQSLHDTIISEAGENYRQDYTTSTQAKIKDVQQTAAVSYVLDPEEYPADALPADGKVGDIAFKDVTASNGKIPLYELEFNGYANNTDNVHTYIHPSDMPSLENFGWDSSEGGYKFNIHGNWYRMISSVDDPHTGANTYFQSPLLLVRGLTEAGKYKIVFDADWSFGGEWTERSSTWHPGISDFTNSTDTRNNSIPSQSGVPGGGVQSNASGEREHFEGIVQITGTRIFENPIYVWVKYSWAFPRPTYDPETQQYIYSYSLSVNISGLRIEKIINEETGETDGGYIETFDRYIDGFYAKVKGNGLISGNSLNTRSMSRSANSENYSDEWKEIQFIQKVDTSENSGLSYGRPSQGAQKTLSLKPNVMRAWFKADPPQVKRSFNQYCVRFTGKPDTNISISVQNDTGWLNKSVKVDSEGVLTIKSGGTVSSENIEYCAYKLTGLTSGQRYYFNFKVNFKDGTTFENDMTKGLGLVFNTTGVINTDDWYGGPNSFDETNLYYSMRRVTYGNFADFSFVATASTMYMCVVVADITSGQTSSLTLSKFVISKTERAYVRDFYIFDTDANDWLPYKPFGSGDDSGGDSGESSLGDLDDVNLQSLTNGQTLYYNSSTGEWVNGDSYELPIASANVLGGIKVGANLSIDANGVLSATASASTMSDLTDVDIDDQTLDAGQVLKWDDVNEKWVNEDEAGGTVSVELTKAEYDALPIADKNDPTKVYYVKNYQPVPQGSNMSDLEDVLIDDQTLDEGQVLKWDSVNEQWVNDDESGGTTVIANPTGTPTGQLNTIQIDSDIYEIVVGGSGGNFEVTKLWENTTGAGTGEQTLSNSIDDFDLLSIWCGVYAEYTGSPYIIQQCMISVSELNALYSSNKHFVFSGYDNRATYMDFYGDKVNVTNVYNNQRLLKVLGVKCGGGASDLADLNDVDFGTLTNGDILQYNSTNQKWENSTPTFTLPVASASTLGGIKIGDLFKMTASNALDMEFGRFLFTASGVATIASSDTYSKQIITVSKLMYRRISQYITQTIDYSTCILAIESVSLHNMSASGVMYGDEEYARTKISISEIADNGNSYDITILISNDMGLYISDFEIWVTGIYIGNPVIT